MKSFLKILFCTWFGVSSCQFIGKAAAQSAPKQTGTSVRYEGERVKTIECASPVSCSFDSSDKTLTIDSAEANLADVFAGERNRHMYCINSVMAASTMTCVGFSAAPTTAPTSSQSDGSDATRPYWTSTSGSTSGNAAGYQAGATAHAEFRYQPKYTAYFKTGSSIAAMRLYVGLQGNNQVGILPVDASNTSSASLMLIAYDTSENANFHCCSGDGTNYSCTDMGLAVASSTAYIGSVEYVSGTSLRCSIRLDDNGATSATTLTKTSNIPTASNTMGVMTSVTTSAAVAKSISISSVTLTQR